MRVRGRGGEGAEKTKRLIWFNFGLILGGGGFTSGLHGRLHRDGGVYMIGGVSKTRVRRVDGGVGEVDGGMWRVGFAPIFLWGLYLCFIKRLHIAVICVYLRKI